MAESQTPQPPLREPNIRAGASAAPSQACAGEFYVGYLPMPRGLVRFLCRLIPGLLIFALGVAFVLSRAQNDPGDGRWDTGVAREFVGVVAAGPYPHLRILEDSASDAVETLLIVEVGKFGGGQRAAPFDGITARVTGWLLERDGRRMIELMPDEPIRADSPLSPEILARLKTPRVEKLGQVTLCGEVVDSKCYLGAMKPGEGKTHKECATLCIAGGIPPVFVTTDPAGRRSYFLLCDPAGQPLDDSILPYVGDPLELAGDLERWDDLHVLKLKPMSVRRL